MSTRILALACGLLFACGSLLAQPPGCTHEGDVAFRFGWGMYTAGMSPYTPPPGTYNLVAVNGPDTTWGAPGDTLRFKVAPYNATAWLPLLCTALDTMCYEVSSEHGWTFVCKPAAGTPQILPAGGYLWYQTVTIQIPCSAPVGSYEMVIGGCYYTNSLGECDPTCPDCADPNVRPSNHTSFYSKDTLYVQVLPALPPPAPTILQDTLTLVEARQPMAYIPFSICNLDQCSPMVAGYHISSRGHIGPPMSVSDTVQVQPGKCMDVFGILNAASSLACVFDTLTIVAWSCAPAPLYDTCVQVVHVVSPCCIPVLTAPVLAVLALALILAAAVFIRRRAATRP